MTKIIIPNSAPLLNQDEMVTIPKLEYEALMRDSKWLECLENAGVDNWGGIDFAVELKHEMDGEYDIRNLFEPKQAE